MIRPLDSPENLIRLISEVSGLNEKIVRDTLIDEATELGTTVASALRDENIPRFVTSKALDQFYEDSSAFLFETAVWNLCPPKEKMRQFVARRLSTFGKKNARIFCFGDGLGFDSAFSAMQGHEVIYFDPSKLCQQFAKSVFEENNVKVRCLDSLEEIEPESIDVLVCLDVLEHIQHPQKVVKQFASWLAPDGLLFVNAPFWLIHRTTPTHLEENRKLSGELKTMYLNNGFRPLDSSLFWDPILLQKSTEETAGRQFGLFGKMRVRMGQMLLIPARWFCGLHVTIARKITQPPREFLQKLKHP